MNKRSLLWILGVLMVTLVGSVVLFNYLGSTVDADGFLHEPFWLALLGGMAGILSFFVALLYVMLAFRDALRKK